MSPESRELIHATSVDYDYVQQEVIDMALEIKGHRPFLYAPRGNYYKI